MQNRALTNHSARFEVPLNWSPIFLDFIIDHKEDISSVYGSIVGEPSGRPIPHSCQLNTDHLPDAQKLRNFVDLLHNAGISFNLIVNSSCYGNRLFSDQGKEWVKTQVRQIISLGIEWITVTSYDLARRISSLAPRIKIIMSVMHNMKDIDAIAFTKKQDFNFAGVVIGKGVTRQIPKLKRILACLQTLNLKGILIANDFCPAPNCPERMSDHNNACAHYYANEEDYVSPSIHCRKMVMQNPVHFLQAPVINPYDINFYENIGVQYFKLTDRVMPDRTLMKVCEAYFNRQHDGNLFDLFTYTSYLDEFPRTPRSLSDAEIIDIYLGGYKEFKARRTHFIYQPFVNAKTLSGPGNFFEFFEEERCSMNCGSRTMGLPGCHYCEDQAERLLKHNQDDLKAVHDNIVRYIKLSRIPKGEIRTQWPKYGDKCLSEWIRSGEPAENCEIVDVSQMV